MRTDFNGRGLLRSRGRSAYACGVNSGWGESRLVLIKKIPSLASRRRRRERVPSKVVSMPVLRLRPISSTTTLVIPPWSLHSSSFVCNTKKQPRLQQRLICAAAAALLPVTSSVSLRLLRFSKAAYTLSPE